MGPKAKGKAKGKAQAKKAVPKPVAQKRPAAWHDAGEELDPPSKKGAPQRNPEDDEDVDGLDGRGTSRSQRYVFQKNLDSIDADVRKRYEQLTDPEYKMAGKQREINRIINAHVGRNAKGNAPLAIKDRAVTMIQGLMKSDVDSKEAEGLDYYTMVGSKYAGNEELAKKAIAAGEVQKNEQNGKYYTSKHTMTQSTVRQRGYTGNQGYEALTDKDFLKTLAFCDDQISTEDLGTDWMELKAIKGAKKPGALADDNDFALMSESFDSVTRVTLCMKRLGAKLAQLSGSSSTGTLKEMSTRAISLCKEIAEPSEKMEAMMVADRSEVIKADVQKSLQEIAPIYKKMVQLYNEMVTLAKSQTKGTKTESQTKGMKCITL